MELHFYTTYDNVQRLREGDEIQVWTKEHASPNDINVSLDMDRYALHQFGEKGKFEVRITQRYRIQIGQ